MTLLAETPTSAPEGVRTCRSCGCSQFNPCPGGCHWIAPDLCSGCVQKTTAVCPENDFGQPHGAQLFDGMAEKETAFRLRGELGIYYGGGASALVMARDIHYGEDGVPRVMGGHVLTREQLDQLIRGVQGAAPTRTVLPAHVIMWDGLRIAWWVPSAKRRIWFNPRRRKDMQHVSRLEVLHPPLLMIADPGHLQLYALAENARPTAATPLYQAPYPNVYETGGVCAGGVKWPKTLDVAKLAEWERCWFDSEGTFPTARKLTLFPGGHAALWAAMLTAETFPVDSLVPLGITVLDALNHTERPQTLPFQTEEIVPVPAAIAEGD